MPLVEWLRLQWDRVLAWAAVGVGILAIVIGWFGVSRSAYPADQLPYIISGGIGGMVLVGVGATVLLSADLRDEWRKLDRIEDIMRESAQRPVDGTVGPTVNGVVGSARLRGASASGR
jgi:hypothetical protein